MGDCGTVTRRDPHLGKTISGRYQILERIGDGGVGVVYKGLQQPIGRTVAVKVLRKDALEERTLHRFLNEAKIIATLRHPHTIKLLDFGQTDAGEHYIVMEYAEGGTLRDLMHEGRVRQIPALRIIRQVCRALEEAHEAGVIHRDLKPENVLFDRVRGEDFVVRVADFGMARVAASPVEAESSGVWRKKLDRSITPPRTRLGTPGYMAPEQAFAREVDGRADLYVVGVLLYEMLTGHPPFVTDEMNALHLAHLHDEVPAPTVIAPGLDLDHKVEELLGLLLAKRPEDRPASAASVVRKIDRILARIDPPPEMSIEVNINDFTEPAEERGEVPDEGPDTEEEALQGRTSRRRLVLWLVGAAAAWALAAATYFVFLDA